jgi:hypothetical protein
MNHSFYSADRTTHSKIVVIALICATAVAGIGIAAHSRGGDNRAEAAPVRAVETGKPAAMASAIQIAIR